MASGDAMKDKPLNFDEWADHFVRQWPPLADRDRYTNVCIQFNVRLK